MASTVERIVETSPFGLPCVLTIQVETTQNTLKHTLSIKEHKQ